MGTCSAPSRLGVGGIHPVGQPFSPALLLMNNKDRICPSQVRRRKWGQPQGWRSVWRRERSLVDRERKQLGLGREMASWLRMSPAQSWGPEGQGAEPEPLPSGDKMLLRVNQP